MRHTYNIPRQDKFALLSQYMDVYIQLLAAGLDRYSMPTFEYFCATKDDDRYSMAMPHFREAKRVTGDRITPIHTHGMTSEDGIAYREYNFWLGRKYFTGGNLTGEYTCVPGNVTKAVKSLYP